jgi:hypothetical protein
LNCGAAAVLDELWVVLVVDEVAAPAIAEPPRASAARAARPASIFLVEWNIGWVLSVGVD